MATERGGETFDDAGLRRSNPPLTFRSYLAVALEADCPLAGSARYLLDGVDLVTIGRGETRQVARRSERGVIALDVRVPGRSMSSSHARLTRAGSDWVLEDLGSRNGSYVDGVRVDHSVLLAGAVVELGHTFFLVRTAVATAPGTPSDLDSAALPPDGPATIEPTLAGELGALARLAKSPVPILLLGESGTGKEVLARAVHAQTGRSGAFVPVNCGAIPEALIEGSLFGHVRGAFSGAVRDATGFVRAADGGTLFLDEIADLPKASQAALLRVLQEREVVPVGSTTATKVDIRLVAATHASLDALVARGDFRRDLFARIAGFTLTLPNLRDRRADLGLLVAALLEKIAGSRAAALTFTPAAALALLRYDFPLNVRELEQALAMAVTLANSEGAGNSGEIDVLHLPATLRAPSASAATPASEDAAEGRDDRLRRELLGHLAAHEGNLAEVARAMGKARMQVHRWCRRFGIDPNVYRR